MFAQLAIIYFFRCFFIKFSVFSDLMYVQAKCVIVFFFWDSSQNKRKFMKSKQMKLNFLKCHTKKKQRQTWSMCFIITRKIIWIVQCFIWCVSLAVHVWGSMIFIFLLQFCICCCSLCVFAVKVKIIKKRLLNKRSIFSCHEPPISQHSITFIDSHMRSVIKAKKNKK